MTIERHPTRAAILIMAGEAQRAADEAIARVERHADPSVIADAVDVVRSIAERQDTLTTDDVWDEISADRHRLGEPRALGCVMRRASRERIVFASSTYRPSTRPECHARPVRVWISLVYQAAA